MDKLKCFIIGCKNSALVEYAGEWICGTCLLKIMRKQREHARRELEDLNAS